LASRSTQAGGDARQAAVAAEGFGRHLDGAAQGVGEVDEAAVATAAFGQGVELLFGDLDLVAGRQRSASPPWADRAISPPIRISSRRRARS
jgi:hypothetical protein